MKTEVKTWSGGATVTGPSLSACLHALSSHWVASGDSGALRISGERSSAGMCSIVVRLCEPRVPYLPERLDAEGEARAASAACDRAMNSEVRHG